ncbi:hypothetical protein FO454_04070 [Staphylococcus lugdunensis]|uniref:Uncharacterized protein n=1 Tax=Staphylococcus lugdunensis TaxID=28035 RepID=A0ABX6BTE3_STALU|nr:hypothetical protein B7454_00230 [Staphylococcus lugdunensis]ARJ17246.1 hypothetical protein B6N54_11760 [Staphylococcus lugdunensis]ARJ28299.1 hypothetical protein B7469_11540 [Staphylococcus lugdunensis]ARJ30725.1 hypothetical protein B6N84_12215 [Staphylococcus lugdunensis]AUY63196.1 hypothetical protein AL501_12640 [Staphylococcus lugdunensis]
MTRIEKAWYKRIFNPVNYCQYRVHNLKHNYVPASFILYINDYRFINPALFNCSNISRRGLLLKKA